MDEILAYHGRRYGEAARLVGSAFGQPECVRTRETLLRHLPPRPAIRLTGVEGPGWIAPGFEARRADSVRREALLARLRAVERQPALLGVSPHLLAVCG